MTEASNKLILEKINIPSDKWAYIFRNGKNKGRWCLSFYDQESTKRYRKVLKDANGEHPPADSSGKDQAFNLGMQLYIDLRNKSDRGEAVNSISWGEMSKRFLAKEQRRISSIPHQGITKARFRLLKTQLRWISDYINDEKKQIHKFKRHFFLNYETWRKQRAIDFGKEIPRQSTINQEMSALRRVFREVGVTEGYVNNESVPVIPMVKLPKDQKHRRDDLSEAEWLELEKCSRLYYIKGKTRLINQEKVIEKTKSGTYKTASSIPFKGARGENQLTHRNMIYLAMRISMDTGIRPGSLRKLQWKDISENTAIPKEERKVWLNIDVPPDKTKTGRSYRIAAPITRHIGKLREITKFKKSNDLLFTNQVREEAFSDKFWRDYLLEMMVEARLADWSEDDKPGGARKATIHSGKTISWYSFRHTYITMRLTAGVPVPVIAANTDTSIKYIQDHYFHYRADESTAALGMGRKVRAAEMDMNWIGALDIQD